MQKNSGHSKQVVCEKIVIYASLCFNHSKILGVSLCRSHHPFMIHRNETLRCKFLHSPKSSQFPQINFQHQLCFLAHIINNQKTRPVLDFCLCDFISECHYFQRVLRRQGSLIYITQLVIHCQLSNSRSIEICRQI